MSTSSVAAYAPLREHLLATHGLRALHDLSSGAFEEINPAQVVVSVVSSIFARGEPTRHALGHKVFQDGTVTQQGETARKRAATVCHEGRHTFDTCALKVVPEWPLVYWWENSELERYRDYPLVSSSFEIFPGVKTGDHGRFLRCWFEVPSTPMAPTQQSHGTATWPSYLKGAAGCEWIEPVQHVIAWEQGALELGVFGAYCKPGTVRRREPSRFFRRGVSYAPIGATFSARAHRLPGVFDNMGPTSFPDSIAAVVCLMNSAAARSTLSALNPGVHFEIADIERLPVFEIEGATSIFGVIEQAFGVHEAHREASVEFRRPGPSPWRHAQDWAQGAVDRPEGTPLPEYGEQVDPEPSTDHVSFALGVALGRFGPAGSAIEGVLDPATADLSHALPCGILFLDTTLDAEDHRDCLGHPAAAPLHAAWRQHGPAIDTNRGLRDWLAADFFKDVHKGMYDNRPVHWPLSSSSRTFVAWVNIHRMNEQTMRVLLADHLVPTLARLDGELNDLRSARDGADKVASRAAEKEYDRVLRARDELQGFVTAVEQCADRGAPPTDPKCPPASGTPATRPTSTMA